MKDIKIICVGKIKEAYLADGIGAQLAAIRKKYPAVVIECRDEPTPDAASGAEERMIKEKEGERILARIREEDYVAALCIDGKHYDTSSWFAHMDHIRDRISGSLIFVIGGSLGLSESVIRLADEKLSFSSMTFPHQLMRLILMEQLAGWAGH
ncbi:MAG: 23S rRNA (pseudouridine(1915)-N(3))-methyltransferase RlmH [Eubacterium sp.]|nr:23S rRNA (pseudouridine(1915)-N(3))-methyltransferase RlmH [Eubacterium sp.]